jgi:hypothetical protein
MDEILEAGQWLRGASPVEETAGADDVAQAAEHPICADCPDQRALSAESNGLSASDLHSDYARRCGPDQQAALDCHKV